MENILSKINSSTKYVSENSRYVKINYERLNKIIDKLDISKIKYWLDSNPYGLLDLSCEEIIDFLLIYHTIGDYCFWGDPKWKIKTQDGKIIDGSYAMLYLLMTRYKEEKSFDMSKEEFKEFLKGNVQIPLLEDRYQNLVIMNNFLRERKISFYELIKNFYKDEELIDFIISNFSYFKDESEYKGRTIYFYKRAQLLASDILHVRKILEHVKVDFSHLPGCADYKIPQVMRCMGILEFSDELANLVDNKIELKEGSEMEVEIRANDLVVLDYMAEKLNERISRMDLNDYIWLLGQDKSKMTKPYHRTLTKHY